MVGARRAHDKEGAPGGKAMRGKTEKQPRKKGAVVWIPLLDWVVVGATLADKHP
jgi:hypothetical protein